MKLKKSAARPRIRKRGRRRRRRSEGERWLGMASLRPQPNGDPFAFSPQTKITLLVWLTPSLQPRHVSYPFAFWSGGVSFPNFTTTCLGSRSIITTDTSIHPFYFVPPELDFVCLISVSSSPISLRVLDFVFSLCVCCMFFVARQLIVNRVICKPCMCFSFVQNCDWFVVLLRARGGWKGRMGWDIGDVALVCQSLIGVVVVCYKLDANLFEWFVVCSFC